MSVVKLPHNPDADTAHILGYAPPRKALLNRPQQILELACLVSTASQGGIGLLAAGAEVVEHLQHGSGELLPGTTRSPWVAALLRFVLRHRHPVRLPDWPELDIADPHYHRPRPPRGPFLGVP